ncbi:hypothetical protein EVAR_36015_1 [Eumeta japonica]|uniref:Uncharacterized protein n=1 Tax=Eumeta variegata TaxID=151549 RepID=A0A4C1WWF9_EUMVA|nr:hypothetical protein EVAR_36015_1 [Eumeta japonica]
MIPGRVGPQERPCLKNGSSCRKSDTRGRRITYQQAERNRKSIWKLSITDSCVATRRQLTEPTLPWTICWRQVPFNLNAGRGPFLSAISEVAHVSCHKIKALYPPEFLLECG